MKTIADAHKALNGDLSNAFEPRRSDIFLTYDNDDGHYVCVSNTTGYTIKEYNRQYICTVEEFNNYKGDDMKTVMDAVNEFKGEWPYVNHYVCVPAKENDVAESGEFQSAKSKYTNEIWVNVCNKSEFNTLVQECMTNFGSSSFKHLAIWQSGLKESKESKVGNTYIIGSAYEFSDNGVDWECGYLHDISYITPLTYQSKLGSKTEWYSSIREVCKIAKPQPKESNMKPVFTQEMSDNGESIKQGMLFECSNGEKAELLLPIDEGGMGVAMFNGEYCIMCQSGIKPIGTKASREMTIADISPYCIVKPEKLIDAIKAGEIHGVTWVGK